MPTLISTLGGSTSNSYVSVAEADTFADNQSWGATWTALANDDKIIALVAATYWLDPLPWNGERCDPSTDDTNLPQALSWPRKDVICDGVTATCTFIPAAVKQAEILLAYYLSQNPDAITGDPNGGGGAAAGTFVSLQRLGDLEQQFSAYPSGEQSSNDCTSCANPEVINKFPWLKDLLKCWVDVGNAGSRIIMRVRS